ncbi:lactoylglutathione lyase [Flavobacterium sp. IMCC34852]|uniref:Lactoylglutathione lyase n=1 Tax=Flavobacterium rivulicola TaxID=2732161 RepID=A0A7Y3R7Q7_9FLAO|nr:VOC family protein [Flavobacterium sp. IMCC34852]NNT71453.1 lactoylglutathione lyase [Flavobacterium sp. IMCC34852]
MKHIQLTETILYVENQAVSTTFYEKLFRQKADLNVPGMTEFRVSAHCKIGLMPNNGIAKILKNQTPHPQTGIGIPRCELYFYVEDISLEYANATALGAQLISPITDRDWGDKVCYFADPDGHIIAFAEKIG